MSGAYRWPEPSERAGLVERVGGKIGHDLVRNNVAVNYTLTQIARGDVDVEDALCRLVTVLASQNQKLMDVLVAAASRAPFSPMSFEVPK